MASEKSFDSNFRKKKINWEKISKGGLLSKEEEYKYFKILRTSKSPTEARRAKKIIIRCNVKLIASICKKFAGKGLMFGDLRHEGELGLLKSIERFDHERGFKFSTYATWWIRQTIGRAIADQARVIRVPVHMVEKISKVQAAEKLLIQELHKNPSDKQIAEKVGENLNADKVAKIKKYSLFARNIEDKFAASDDSQFSEFLEDKNIENANSKVTRMQLIEKTNSLIYYTLEPQEDKLIRLRIGKPPLCVKNLIKIIEDRKKRRKIIRYIIENNILLGALFSEILNEIQGSDLFKEYKRFQEGGKTHKELEKLLKLKRKQIRALENQSINKMSKKKGVLMNFLHN